MSISSNNPNACVYKQLHILIPTLFYLSVFLSFPNNIINAQDVSVKGIPKASVITSKDSLRSLQSLVRGIEEILSNKVLKNSNYGIAVYSLDRQKYIYQKNVDKLLKPASNTKLFTSFTALSAYGPDFQVKTTVYTDAKEIKDGVLDGNLYVFGRGDALLSVPDIEYLADEIKKAGINQITGNIFGDASFFDNKYDRIMYSGDKEHVENIPSLRALNIESNTAKVIVTSGPVAGVPVKAQIIPPSDAFTKTVSAKVAGAKAKEPVITKNTKKCKTKTKVKTKKTKHRAENNISPMNAGISIIEHSGGPIVFESHKTPSGGGIHVTSNLDASGKQYFIISGSLAPNRTYTYSYNIYKPELVVAGTLRDRLISGGITVNGTIGLKSIFDVDSTGNLKKLAEFGRPLTEIITIMNKNSDNYLAEIIYKMIGATAGNHKDNASETRKIMKREFEKYAIPFKDCALMDGSGLSRKNYIKVETIINMLIKSAQYPYGKAWESTFAIAGLDGTLRHRMMSSAAEVNLHAKTGTMRDVAALSGYLKTLDGERLAFSFVFNGPGVGSYKKIEDDLGILLSQFFYYNEEK
jgi:serine-type D-Ala-D-Ala carboxypeptidase/endopeptidase (penicillin-binding protein 4)